MKEKVLTGIGVVIGFILVGGFLYFTFTEIFGGWLSQGDWRGTYYQDINSKMSQQSERLQSLDDCRLWATGRAEKDNKKDGEWDYSCGRKCKYSGRQAGSITDEYTCEEVTK